MGRVSFVDRTNRDVFADEEGQYVLGDDGEKVRGVWLLPDDEADRPLIVPAVRVGVPVLAAVAALSLASGCGPTTDEDRAALALKRLGADVRRNADQPGRPVCFVDLGGRPATDADMQDVGRLTHLRYLNLSRTRVTDEGLKELARLRGLRWLLLARTGVTDATLVEICTLDQLQHLDLAGAEITDDGLAELRGLAGHLESIDLSDTAVSDAGLRSLHGLKHLWYVGLVGTDVTEAGVKELRAALPQCEVER
jgi:hypothetical protein